jgi:Ca2+-transporting ATPase
VEAAQRLVRDGANLLPREARHGLWPIILGVLREPMFLLLVAAGALYLLMGAPGDAALLLSFVFVVMGITIFQERRTERALDALRDLASPQALVLRDGKQHRIPASDLVVGDHILLSEGDRIPADAFLRESRNLAVDESLLTGEAVPVTKLPSAAAALIGPPGGDGLATVFSGTLVTTGQGRAEVVATGLHAEIGKIGSALAQVKPERTRLQSETGRMVRRLAVAGLVMCLVVIVVYALTRGDDAASWKQGLLAGIAMAMAIIPEEFPVIVTIFLALGAWRIAHQRVLTRRMPAIEALGAATVLCTDKTGTLTRNQMSVARLHSTDGTLEVTAGGPPFSASAQALIETAVLASRVDPFDPMERAIHLAAQRSNQLQAPQPTWRLDREYPLSPELLAVSQAWDQGAGKPLVVACKGAPEAIADLCALSPELRAAVLREATTMAQDGLRVLGVAQGSAESGTLPPEQRGLHLTYVGLLGLADPLRENVPAAVAECHAAGIRVVMITGDYPSTAQSIGRSAGIANCDDVITGSELEHMPEPELARRIHSVGIFARVAPTQKLRIVEAFKADHQIVAMTGDGVNDAPALKAAHIGIAMGGRGTDVAREAAALVLLDDDFAAIVAAIRMGRRIFDNIKKAISFTFAVHVPIAGLSVLPVFIPDWPLLLLPVHIVFLELVIDPSCTLIFESEQADAGIMQRPPRDVAERLFSWQSIGLSLLQGAGAFVVCVLVYMAVVPGHDVDTARTLMFVTLIASLLTIIVTNRSWSRSLFAILRTPNTAQWWVVAGTIALLAVVLLIPIARDRFHFAPVHGTDVLLSVIAGGGSILWFEVLKWYRRRQHPAAIPQPAITSPQAG